MVLKYRTRQTYPTNVGIQPIQPKSATPPASATKPPRVSLREIQGYEYLRQLAEQQRQEDVDRLDQAVGPIASADISPTTFITTDIVPQSVESYGPDDPRANPAGSLVSAQSGFLPPPPA